MLVHVWFSQLLQGLPWLDKSMEGFGTRFVLIYQLSQMAFFPSLSSGNRVFRNQRDTSIPQEFPVNYASDWAKKQEALGGACELLS